MSFRSETQIKIQKYYEEFGCNKTVNLGLRMLNSSQFRSIAREGSSIIQGEIAETVCRVMLEEYIKVNGLKDWKVYQSIFIRDLDVDSDKITEIDIILVTPQRVYLIEVKSYMGTKEIVDPCNIVRDGKVFDVYSQHMGHYRGFYEMFKVVTSKGMDTASALEPLVFLFSKGTYDDQRSLENKTFMPVVDHLSLIPHIESKSRSSVVWDTKTLMSMLDYIQSKSDKLTNKHLSYVRKLRKERNG